MVGQPVSKMDRSCGLGAPPFLVGEGNDRHNYVLL